jgi:hypothetical protein
MVWIALGLLAFTTFLVALNTSSGRWTMSHWRAPPRTGPMFSEFLQAVSKAGLASPWDFSTLALQQALTAAYDAALLRSGFFVFSNWLVFSIFCSFLMPLWSLSFATEGLGREREAGNLVWLLTRPLSRPAIYLAKFLAILPWCLGLNLGGFALLCLVGGEPGRLALSIYWPAVWWGSLAFCALFHLMAACFRRAAVVALLYVFFLETILGNLPGNLKRVSISFYVRCLMFDRAHDFGIQPERPLVYLPVSGTTAWFVLAGLTVGLLLAGMLVFARTEYLDVN